MLAIETRGLSKAYRGRNVVDGLDMHVARGDIYGFVGRNGAGKSTTMKMICGMIRPTAGEVRSTAWPPTRRAALSTARPSASARWWKALDCTPT